MEDNRTGQAASHVISRGQLGTRLLPPVITLGTVWAVWLLLTRKAGVALTSLYFTYVSPGMGLYLFLCLVGGGLAGMQLTSVLSGWSDRLESWWQRIRDWPTASVRAGVVGIGFVGGVGVALAIHRTVPLTTDESLYRFSAQVLSMGRLTAPSPPDPIFWEQSYMRVEDGWISQYFLGWPAMLMTFVAAGVPWLANPVIHGLTAGVMYDLLRRDASPSAAAVGAALFAIGPLPMMMAGTMMSHPTAMFFLAVTWWFAGRASLCDVPWWVGAGLAVAFCAAFFTRPLTAIGIGGLGFGLGMVRLLRARRWPALIAAGFVCALMAAMFLGVNVIQNGSPWKVSYVSVIDAQIERDMRFTYFGSIEAGHPTPRVGDVLPRRGILIEPLQGLFRVATEALALPVVLMVWLIYRGWCSPMGWWLAALLAHVCTHATTSHAGVEIMGAPHHHEQILPLTMLVGLALDRFSSLRVGHPMALVVAGWVSTWAFGAPVRLAEQFNVSQLIVDLNHRLDQLPKPAIVYVPLRLPARWNCAIEEVYRVPQSSRCWRESPDPWLSRSVLLANHLDIEADRAHHQEHFRDRHAFVMVIEEEGAVEEYLPLYHPLADRVPKGRLHYRDAPEAHEKRRRRIAEGLPALGDSDVPDWKFELSYP